MTTTALPPVATSSWTAVRLALVAVLIAAASMLAFAVGHITVGATHVTRTITVTRVVHASPTADASCRNVRSGVC